MTESMMIIDFFRFQLLSQIYRTQVESRFEM